MQFQSQLISNLSYLYRYFQESRFDWTVMESVNLTQPAPDSQFDAKKCIMCQNTTHVKTGSKDRGRKRVREASEIRNDHVTKRLKLVEGDDFVYHMTNKQLQTIFKMLSIREHVIFKTKIQCLGQIYTIIAFA